MRNSVSVSHKLPNSQRLPAVWLTPVWERDVTKAPCRFGPDIFGAQEMWRLVIAECEFSWRPGETMALVTEKKSANAHVYICNLPVARMSLKSDSSPAHFG